MTRELVDNWSHKRGASSFKYQYGEGPVQNSNSDPETACPEEKEDEKKRKKNEMEEEEEEEEKAHRVWC